MQAKVRTGYFLFNLCALFARWRPMKITRIALIALMLGGCQAEPEADTEPDTLQQENLGPGTDPSVLIPPDTPMTTRGPSSSANAGGPAPKDTIR